MRLVFPCDNPVWNEGETAGGVVRYAWISDEICGRVR